ncbi:MAG: potassium-transporting ATPase subunit KdpA [Bryobacteraceae bacterium]|nr:potassium-transporting ATPase subunit KdpA [Bryobacteraceae bacterium]
MTSSGVLQILLFSALVLACAKPLGVYMSHVFEGRRTFLHPALRWLEVLTYKMTGVKEDVEQRWTHYTASLLSFSIFAFAFAYPELAQLNIMGLHTPQSAVLSAVRSRCCPVRTTSRIFSLTDFIALGAG